MVDIIIFVIVAGGLLLAHEFGHFLVARWRRVRIEEFGIGFPPRLAKLFEVGGVQVTLNLIPFGGFVRPAGEDDPTVPGGLSASSKTTRTLVLLAGPATNLLIGFLAFAAAFKFASPDLDRVLITDVRPNSPAAAAGILPGDVVVKLDDQPINSFQSMQEVIAQHLGAPVIMTVQRNGEIISLDLVPRTQPPEGEGPIGVILGYPTKAVGVAESVSLGGRAAIYQLIETVRLPARLLRGEVRPEEARVSGLKGIYDILSWATEIDESTRRPFMTLQLVGIVSIGFALANLLPVPALDGGRLMFVTIEAILGRRISPRYEGLAHAIGFTLLLALMAYVTFQDFINPISLPR